MILLVAGGRDYRLTEDDLALLDTIHARSPVGELVCGGGAVSTSDLDAMKWAKVNRVEVTVAVVGADKHLYWDSARPRTCWATARHLAAKRAEGFAVAVLLLPGGAELDALRRAVRKLALPLARPGGGVRSRSEP